MKKSIFVNAAIIALAMLASCQKEQFTENVTPVTGVTEFTATIEQPTKTVIAANGKVTWKAGDEITVTDAASASAVYVAGSDGASTTFTLKEGETAVGTEPYTATYGDIDNQEYDAAGANCPLTAAQTSTTTFKFSSPYAVVKITAESVVEEVIKSVDVKFGDKTYTLDCGEGVTLTSEAIDFFVAVNPKNHASLSVSFHTADKTATKVRTQNTTLAAKDLLQVQFTFTEGDWESPEADTPEGALKGVFTVGAGPDGKAGTDDDVKVYFSQGNLRYVVGTQEWGFYEQQYGYCNTSTYEGRHSDTVSLFTWGYDAAKSIDPDGTDYVGGHATDGESFSPSEDWGYVFGGESSVWRTLTTEEWHYLVNTRTVNGGTGGGKSYKVAKINTDGIVVSGLILYPDNYTETAKAFYTCAEWTSLETTGCVFLPAAGYREGSEVGQVIDLGYYWSSSAYELEMGAYEFCFDNEPCTKNYQFRDIGHSVRLVTDVSAAPTEPEYVVMKMGTGDDAYTLKWRKMNLGANTVAGSYETCCGDYYAWGVTEPYYKTKTWDEGKQQWDRSGFEWKDIAKGQDQDGDEVSGYRPEVYYQNSGIPAHVENIWKDEYEWTTAPYDDTKKLKQDYDAVVQANIGDGWRMPTIGEFNDLCKACGGNDDGSPELSEITSSTPGKGIYALSADQEFLPEYKGVAGLLFCDGESRLFFPTAGIIEDGKHFLGKEGILSGCYWSSTYYGEFMANSFVFNIGTYEGVLPQCPYDRHCGGSVRPVSD